MGNKGKPSDGEKIFTFTPGIDKELPKEIQKRLMDFFMRTSIPRKKVIHLSTKKEDR